jgi:cytochrome d ubiquinol oxidase subunit I
VLGLDATELARIQFALNITFHILFPTVSIGLAWLLLFFRLRYTLTRDDAWEYAYYFWVKVFALTFAIGVVSGVTMSFQFGTNWPGFTARAGNITGPLLGYEVLTAFFIEATFLAVMLFGKDRVSNRMHLTASALVAIGTTASAFWILALNSWMQTPQGYTVVDGKFYVDSWFDVIFNPSFPYRLAHMVNASVLTASFLVAGTSASRILRNLHGPGTERVLRTGVLVAAVAAPLQVFLGDQHGLNTFEHQPAKIAALEAVWHTERSAPFTLIALPDAEQHRNRFAIEIPRVGSLLLTHTLDGEVRGLDEFEGAHPPVLPLFVAFRVMVGVGFLMVGVAWWAAFAVLRARPLPRLLQRALAWLTFSGWAAVLAGWYVTEIGRQPWIVYGQLATADVAADHPPGTVAGSLLAYAVLYAFLLAAYIATLRHMSATPAKSQRLRRRDAAGPIAEER